MVQVLAVLTAVIFADVTPPASPPPASAVDQPLEMTAALIRGELRVGEKATFLVSIRNRGKVDQKLGRFKSGGWNLVSESGTATSSFRNTPTHWNCGGPVRVILKPNQADTFEYVVDLSGTTFGPGFLAFDFTYSYLEGGNCVVQPLTWSRTVEVGHAR